MSQRKEKYMRRVAEQYGGMAEDVDDLRRRVGAIEARHRKEDRSTAAAAVTERERYQAAERLNSTLNYNFREDAPAVKLRYSDGRPDQRRRRRDVERRKRALRRRKCAMILAALALAVYAVFLVRALAAEGGSAPPAQPVVMANALNFVDKPAEPSEGEDELEAEKIEAALLASGYFSDAVPMPYQYQDYMRTQCERWGVPYALALAVAQVESGFDMDAVGTVGEVGMMQLNPGPEGAYHAELREATGMDPTTPEGNIAGGCYLLGKYIEAYGDPGKAAMAYNMGAASARRAWAAGTTSTRYSKAVLEAMEQWPGN